MQHSVRIAYVFALAGVMACGAPPDDRGDDPPPLASTTQAVVTPPPPVVASAAVGTLPGSLAVSGDGAAGYTLPIETPAGRAGIEPHLALAYSSRAGNGLAGVGWSLGGLSQIGRCGSTFWRDGILRPVELHGLDHFCLDGARLLEVGRTGVEGPPVNAAECTSATMVEYRTEPDTFAKVIACGADLAGPLEWIVYGKSGAITRYGSTAGGRLDVVATLPDANGDASTVTTTRRLGWLMDRVQDRAGNYLTVGYGQIAATDQLEWWPDRIDYTGFGATAPNRAVVFRYGCASGAGAIPCAHSWSTYVRGVELPHRRVLTSVTTYAPSPASQPLPFVRDYALAYTRSAQTGRPVLATVTACDGLGGCLPATRFTYSAPAISFRKNSHGAAPAPSRVETLFATDVSGDGKDDLLYQELASGLRYDRVRIAGGDVDTPVFGAATQLSPMIDLTPRLPYDVTEDGKTDLVTSGCTQSHQECEVDTCQEVCDSHEGVLWSSDGTTLHEALHQPLCTGAASAADCADLRAMADVNGDGEPDALRNQDVMLSWANVGAAWTALGDPLQRPSRVGGPIQHVDVDGDGAPDVLAPYTYGSGTTRRYDAFHVRGDAAAPVVTATALSLDLNDDNCQVFVDVNGDGLADVVDVRDAARVRLNRGDGRFTAAGPASPWAGTSTCAQAAMPAAPWLGWRRAPVIPVDYNQDGLGDLLVLEGSAGAAAIVLVSTGTTFTAVTLSAPNAGIPVCGSIAGNGAAATVTDANGDGLFDVAFVCSDTTTGTGGRLDLYTQRTTALGTPAVAGGLPDVLVKVTDGLGALRAVDYKLLTDPTVYSHTTSFVQPMLMVASESIDDGAGNPIVVAQHLYEDGTTATDSEGWLGFRRHTTIDPRTGARHRVTYASDLTSAVPGYVGGRTFHPWKGEIVEDIAWAAVGGRSRGTRTRRTLALTREQFGNGAIDYFTNPSEVTVDDFDAAGSFDPDAPGTPVTTVTTHTVTNLCADPVHVVTSRPGAATVTTDRTYSAANNVLACDLGPTWLDLLSLESTTSAGQTVAREIEYVVEADGTGRVKDVIERWGTVFTDKVCTRVVSRDRFGNPTVIDRTAGDYCTHETIGQPEYKTRTTTTTFDPVDGIAVVSVRDPAGLVTSQVVHSGLGVALSTTDADGRTTYVQHDGFGRATRTDLPDATWTTTTRARPATGSRCGGGGYTDAQFALMETDSASDGSSAVTCIDRDARVVRRASTGFGGAWSYVDTTYVASFPDRVYQVSRPHRLTDAVTIASRATYDAAGRVVMTCTGQPAAPDQLTACTTTTFNGADTDVCEADGKTHRRSTTDAAGRLVATSTFLNASTCADGTQLTTSFSYGAFDTVVQIADAVRPVANLVTQEFDGRGRRIRLIDPDRGTSTYTYSVFDELLTDTNGAGVTTSMSYDFDGRLISRQYGPTESFVYGATNAKPLPKSTTNGTVARAFTYDTLGRPSKSSLTLDSTTYDTTFTYDSQSRPVTTTTPSVAGLGRLIIRTEYDAAGVRSRLELGRASATCTTSSQCQTGETCRATLGNVCGREIWHADLVDAEGRVTRETYGNGLTAERAYTGGYLSTIKTGTLSGGTLTNLVQSDAYTYAVTGDLATRANALNNASETFTYDSADRLIKAQVTGRTAVTYLYDHIGNLTVASDVVLGTACSAGATMQYNKTNGAGPHALTNVVCGTSNTILAHDANGNHTSGLSAGDAYTWVRFGKLATATSGGETWAFTYDADRQRVKKARTAGSTTPWTTEIDAGLVQRRLKTTGEQDVFTIPIGAATLEVVWDWNGTSGTQTLQYLHPDRLGSPTVITSSTGAVLERRSFDSWGNPRGTDMVAAAPSPSKTVRNFTGHDEDRGVATGGKTLVDMGGRMYSPYLKRFWSPDPFVQDPAYGPSWNRFSYVFNNPLRFTDPTGYDATSTFFEPIIGLGDYAGGTWFQSGVAMAANGSGVFIAEWDGKTRYEFTATPAGDVEVRESYTVVIRGEEGQALARAAGMDNVDSFQIATSTYHRVRAGAPAPVGLSVRDLSNFYARAAQADQRRRFLHSVAAMQEVQQALEWLIIHAPLPEPFEAMRDRAFVIASGSTEDLVDLILGTSVQGPRKKKRTRYTPIPVRERSDDRQRDGDKLICTYCGVEMTTEPGYDNSREFEHIDGFAKGGDQTDDNICSACRRCNRNKGTRDVVDWIDRGLAWFL